MELSNGKVKTTVANLRIIMSIKNKIQAIILNPKYKDDVKKFVGAFNDVTKLHNDYYKTLESKFKPKTLLKELRKQTIQDTVNKLTEGGVGVSISEEIGDILRTNITSGVEYADLVEELQSKFTDTDEQYGLVTKYGRQIATDAINQYSRQYNQAVASDLGYEWFAYQGTDIKTTRPFCDACTDIRYFHISQIPELLMAKGLFYTDPKTGERKKVEINKKTGLPYGMYNNTNPANFLTYLGGYNCRHQANYVSEDLVQFQAPDIYNKVIATSAYKQWKKQNEETPSKPVPEKAEVPELPEELKKPPQQKKADLKPKTKQNKETKQSGQPQQPSKRAITPEERRYRGNTDERFDELFLETPLPEGYSDEDIANISKVNSVEEIEHSELKQTIKDWLKSSETLRIENAKSAKKIAFMRALSVPTKHDVLYRGMKFSTFSPSSSQYMLYNHLRDKVFKVGNVFSGMDVFEFETPSGNVIPYENSAVSYTNSRKIADRFASWGFGSDSMKSIVVTLVPTIGKTIHGLDLTKISYEDESEVVIGNGYKYRVVNVEQNSNGDMQVLIEQII